MHLSTIALAVTAAALAPLGVHAGQYREPVIDLDAKSFKTAMDKEHASMVAFVAPWCGHCKTLGPEFTAAAASLAPLIPFYTVDCDAAQNKALCAKYDVKGYPTVKAFPKGAKGSARDYNGERARGPLIEYAKGLIPDRVKKLRADGDVGKVVDKFLDEKDDLPHALLVHPSAPSIPFLWKVLGHRLAGKAHVGYIRDTSTRSVLGAVGTDLSKTFDGARLLFWPSGSGSKARTAAAEYEGTLKFNSLLEWLDSAIDGVIPEIDAEARAERAAKVAEAQPKAAEPSKDTAAEDAAAARAKRQAKMDEAERRDRIRREKAAAKAAAEAEAVGGTPVEDAPEAQPAGEAVDGQGLEDIMAALRSAGIEVESVEMVDDDDDVVGGSPVDAPRPEVEEAAEDEVRKRIDDEL